MFSVYVVWLSVLSLNILKLHITFRQEILIILLIPGLAFTGSEYQYLGSGQLEPVIWLFDTGQWVPVWQVSIDHNMVNNIHEKLLDSDWLRAVLFKCNTSAKSVTPIMIDWKTKGNFVRQWYHVKWWPKSLCRTFEWEKMASRKIFGLFLGCEML